MQRSTTINAQDLCSFLELLLIGLLIIHIFIVVVIFILVAAARRSVSLPLLGLAAASSSAGTFLAGSSSTFLGLFLPPTGEIDNSVLVAVGQFLTMAAAGLGIKEYVDGSITRARMRMEGRGNE